MSASAVAVGAVTALGLDWPTSCAASRAGVRRISPLDYFPLQGANAGDVQLCAAHSIGLLTRGFCGYGRIIRLLSGAMLDLRNRAEHLIHLQCPKFYLAFPILVHSEDAASATSSPSIESVLADSARLANWPNAPELAFRCFAGNSGTAQAFRAALEDFSNARAEWAIVGAVDSLLDVETLSSFQTAGRLKHRGVAAGLIPGEAGVLFLLSRNGRHDELGLIKEALVYADNETSSLSSRPVGQRLAEMLSALIKPASNIDTASIEWIVSDENGEPYKALEWGHAMLTLRGRSLAFAHATSLLPSLSFGDTGAANSAIGAALLLANWRRVRTAPRSCAVLAASEQNLLGGILLQAPPLPRA